MLAAAVAVWFYALVVTTALFVAVVVGQSVARAVRRLRLRRTAARAGGAGVSPGVRSRAA